MSYIFVTGRKQGKGIVFFYSSCKKGHNLFNIFSYKKRGVIACIHKIRRCRMKLCQIDKISTCTCIFDGTEIL